MKNLRFLYSTAEAFPSYRVDLTELFSAGLARRGHAIDWHMELVDASHAGTIEVNANERIIGCPRVCGRSVFARIVNALLGVRHELRLLWLPYSGEYDFVQVRDKVGSALLALVGARIARTRFFYWMSFPYAEAGLFKAKDKSLGFPLWKRSLLYLKGLISLQILYRVVLPLADHVFVQSDRMKADVAARGIAPESLTPVPMCIRWEAISTAALSRPAEPWLAGRRLLVYVGTLVRVRRLDFLVEVMGRVRGEFPGALLVFVGDGPAEDVALLEAAVQRFGVGENVRFLGFLPMEQAWEYIKVADVCLSPLRPSPILDPGTPTKIIEYLALGRPVVANEHPDQAKILRESGAGILVPYDPDAWAAAIVQILGDGQSAAAMGERGPPYVRAHRTYEELVPRMEAKYLELVGGVLGNGRECAAS